jgi:tellurite resistance protein
VTVSVAPAPAARILPLNYFAISLGLSGLGGAWSAAEGPLGAQEWPADLLFGVAAVVWTVFTVYYVISGIRRTGSFRADLRHPATGPFAAYIPVVAILLTAHFGTYFPSAAPWLIAVFVAALAVVAAQLLTFWLTGGLTLESLHPGYFLPLVAGAFIASIGFSSAGLHTEAISAFGVGVFFWLVIGTIVTGRLITGAPLAAPVRPSLAVLLAPPATGGVSWFLISGGLPNPIQDAFAGVLVIMLLVQLMLVRQYLQVPFTISYWTFTFPIAAATNYAVRWVSTLQFAGWQAVAWIVLGVASLVIAAILVRSVMLWVAARGAGREAAVTTQA